MANTIEIKEVSTFLSLLNKITTFSQAIRASKSEPELERNLAMVDKELTGLKDAKTAFIRTKVNHIDKEAKCAINKYEEVEKKAVDLHREASNLNNIIRGLNNYSKAILQCRANETTTARSIVEEFRHNLYYVDKPVKDMLGITTLENGLDRALSKSNTPYVELEKRTIQKLEQLTQVTQTIITNARGC